MAEPERRIARAQLRQKIAAEVVEWCRSIAEAESAVDTRELTATALELHDLHARHARELGDHRLAELAEERYDRELDRRFRS